MVIVSVEAFVLGIEVYALEVVDEVVDEIVDDENALVDAAVITNLLMENIFLITLSQFHALNAEIVNSRRENRFKSALISKQTYRKAKSC